MKSFLLLAVVVPASLPSCLTVYEAQGTCFWCEEGKQQTEFIFTDGESYCSEDQAKQALEQQCHAKNISGVVLDLKYTATETFDVGQCDAASRSPLTPGTARMLNGLIDPFRPRPAVPQNIAAMDGQSCAKPGVNFTVVARNQNQDDQAPCDNAREVRVVYEKYVGEFEPPEEVTLSAIIPFGGSHTFTVTDAYPSEDGSASYFYVIYQLYDFIPNEVCEPVPFTEGGMSRGFANQLKDGGTLDITYLPIGSGSTFAYTITNPPSPMATLGSPTTTITPIPDPRFAARRP